MVKRSFLTWVTAVIAAAIIILAPTPNVAEPLKYGVVISAMYAGGGNTGATYTHDYIEIFNASNAPVDVTGWSVQYANPVSAHWQKTFLPEVVLQPGQYLLARQDDGPHGTVAPPADAQGSVGMQGDGSYKVTIVRSRLTIHDHSPYLDPAMQGKIEDFFGGGVANHWEGQPANNGFPTNWTQAWFRHGGGCQDTDNNNNDFYVGTAYPNARSMGSPLAPCAPTNPTGATGTITSTETVFSGQQVSVAVNDADVTAASINVTAAASNGDTETLTLNGSGGAYSGTFTVANAPASSGNGSLELKNGTITFTYVDALGGGGQTNQNRTDVTTVKAIGTTGTINAPSSIVSGANNTYTITVTDADLNGAVVDVTVTSDAGELQVVSVGKVSAGVYSATFDTTNAAPTPNNGLIEGHGGDTLTAAYVDKLDSSGNQNQTRTAVTGIVAANATDNNIELVVNGGLEDGRTGWTFSAGAKRKCRGFGDESNCGFRLRPKTNAQQRGVMGPIFKLTDAAAGDVLQISAAVRTKKTGKQRVVKVIIKYVDPTAGAAGNGKDKFSLFVEQATTGYETFSENFVLDGDVKGGRIVVANTLTVGNLRVDDVSVLLRPTGTASRAAIPEAPAAADGLLPVPAAPDAFRGSN